MRRVVALVAVALGLFPFVGGVLRANAADSGVVDAGASSCIQSWPEARMQAYGYNHIVHLRDTCAVAADCVVTTDVNPDPTRVSVDAKSETEVNTYLGSPARVFTPTVTCTMRSR